MIKIYVYMITSGKMSIDEVPEKWRDDVRKALEVV